MACAGRSAQRVAGNAPGSELLVPGRRSGQPHRAEPAALRRCLMQRSLRLSLLVVVPAALALAADAPKPPAMDDQQVANVKDAKWAAPKDPAIPPGVMGAP